MRYFLLGLLLMLGGVVTLLAMTAGFFETGMVIALLAFVATLSGLAVGLFGIIEWLSRRQRSKPPNSERPDV